MQFLFWILPGVVPLTTSCIFLASQSPIIILHCFAVNLEMFQERKWVSTLPFAVKVTAFKRFQHFLSCHQKQAECLPDPEDESADVILFCLSKP